MKNRQVSSSMYFSASRSCKYVAYKTGDRIS